MTHPPKYGPMMLAKRVRYCGVEVLIVCDGKCEKAWGIATRAALTHYPDGAPDKFVPDADLGTAPADPRTYEGDDAKPVSPSERLNKWCIRECERGQMYGPPPLVRPFVPCALWEPLPKTALS